MHVYQKKWILGLDNSAEYTIFCCDASYQIIGMKMSEMSRL